MSESFDQAWVLLGVGMVTVFSVLLLVVIIGNTLIFFVNRFLSGDSSGPPADQTGKGDIHPAKVAAIVAGVKNVTGGRGNVIDIRKK
jgi:oxaloacetate decarboxylase gamma subunit